MNVSGPWIAKSILAHASSLPSGTTTLPIAILHDSLELSPGELKWHSISKSASGHNGIKSIKEHLPHVERKLRAHGVELEVKRLAIGIGRPTSRDADVVADYVLRKMSGAEVARIEGCSPRAVKMLGEWVASLD
jgi:peptidyl-tRNA hydrolase, PTH1 family